MIRTVDENGDGKINYQEFRIMIGAKPNLRAARDAQKALEEKKEAAKKSSTGTGATTTTTTTTAGTSALGGANTTTSASNAVKK